VNHLPKENPSGDVLTDGYNISQNDMSRKGGRAVPATPRHKRADPSFGQRLRRIREQRSWTQGHLAEESGLTAAAVSQIESGDRQPSFKTLSRLAGAFGITVGYLLGEEADLPSELKEFFRDLEALDAADVRQLKDFATFLRTKSNPSAK
jgi:transcriptional regulator with XRE-family HTH domain